MKVDDSSIGFLNEFHQRARTALIHQWKTVELCESGF